MNLDQAAITSKETGFSVVGDAVYVPFPVLEQKGTIPDYCLYSFDAVLRNTHGLWQYWNAATKFWEPAIGVEFFDHASGASVVFENYETFRDKTVGFCFQNVEEFSNFLDVEVVSASIDYEDLIATR
jgi:hypothetical protein